MILGLKVTISWGRWRRLLPVIFVVFSYLQIQSRFVANSAEYRPTYVFFETAGGAFRNMD